MPGRRTRTLSSIRTQPAAMWPPDGAPAAPTDRAADTPSSVYQHCFQPARPTSCPSLVTGFEAGAGAPPRRRRRRSRSDVCDSVVSLVSRLPRILRQVRH